MKIAYFDCFSGAAGDMILAALIDAGCPIAGLQEIVARLNLPAVTLSAERVKRGGIAALHAVVHVPAEAQKRIGTCRRFCIIDAANLPNTVADAARRIFQRLAEAEARVHATPVEKVHFHEVGAADAIVDIVCAAAGLHLLGIERVECSPIPTGSGTVVCQHGVMPVPAPATANLLIGAPIAACDEPGELTTPTGAAILTTLAVAFGPPPAMRPLAAGYGAGTREGKTRPNLLRVLVGETGATGDDEGDAVDVLEAQIDDADGQTLALACERLLEAGALDCYLTPIIMKKGRPACLLSVLSTPADASRLATCVMELTPTFGIRRTSATRTKLARRIDRVQTAFGEIRVKVGSRSGRTLRARPEYDDCAAAARAHRAPLEAVRDAALESWKRTNAQ